MATNTINNKVIAYSGDVNTAPNKFTQLTGTITTTGVMVYGTATLFTTEIAAADSGMLGSVSKLEPHGWLLNNVNGETRRIKSIVSDIQLVLESGFTNEYNGTVKYVKPSRTKQMSFVQISGTVIVDGVTLATSEGSGWGDTANTNVHTNSPIVIDSTAGVLHLTRFDSN